MKLRLPKVNKAIFSLIPWIIICTAANVFMLSFSGYLNLPLYFDAVGTILISFVWGYLPGITVAVLTNVIYSFLDANSLYFALLGVIIAIRADRYMYGAKKSVGKFILMIVDMAILTGGIGALFQWIILGKPQFVYVSDTAGIMAGDNNTAFLAYALLLTIGLNVVDKGISSIFSILVYHIIPEKIREKLWNSGWRQSPLSNSEVKEITANKKDGTTSIRVNISFILMFVAIILSLVLSDVSARINYEEAKKDGRKTASNVSAYAATLFDTESLDEYLADGARISSYSNVKYRISNNMLTNLRKTFPDIEYLYLYQIREDGCYIVFDTDEEIQKRGFVGEKLEFDDDFLPLVPSLLRGEKIEVQEVQSRYGYFITAYEPIPDTDGNPTTYYVGADIAIDNYSKYVRTYVIKMTLTFSGFFALILAYGMWMSNHSLVFPIGALDKGIEELVNGLDDQEKLDESVKNLEKIDIQTNDEIETLYDSLRELANTIAEQMRSIRILARSNEKIQKGLIVIMADIVENQSMNSKTHIQRITAYVRIIMDGLKRKGYYSEKLTDKYMGDVEMTSPLYDIGKIKIPEAIINKPGRLNDEEWEIMMTHPKEGKKILDNAINTVEGETYLKEARNMAAYHHENWDGTGYPYGYHGEVIPLSARIMAIADTFDELTAPRIYKKPVSPQEAMEIIKDESGKKFDPKCVEAFVDSFTEIKNVLRKFPDE